MVTMRKKVRCDAGLAIHLRHQGYKHLLRMASSAFSRRVLPWSRQQNAAICLR